MALLQIDASTGAARLFDSTAPLGPALARALDNSLGPVTIMVHGYKYAPGHTTDCPHLGLFAQTSRSKNPNVISWPRHLQTGGLMLGFGWAARGGLRSVYQRAWDTGGALCELIAQIRALAPARPIHVLCHSMGARVALAALSSLPAGSVTSLLMLAAAEHRSVVHHALQTPAGRSATVWHITSGENDLYDFLFDRLIAPAESGDGALGTAALPGLHPVVLDDAPTLTALARLGFRIAPPTKRICHWSPYLRGGVFGLYSALIRGDLRSDILRCHLPVVSHRRWDRVLPRWSNTAPLPFAQDASV